MITLPAQCTRIIAGCLSTSSCNTGVAVVAIANLPDTTILHLRHRWSHVPRGTRTRTRVRVLLHAPIDSKYLTTALSTRKASEGRKHHRPRFPFWEGCPTLDALSLIWKVPTQARAGLGGALGRVFGWLTNYAFLLCSAEPRPQKRARPGADLVKFLALPK